MLLNVSNINATYLHPFFTAVVGFSTLADFTAGTGGPILPHPGFDTRPAVPPSVILLAPPPNAVFTGESLALLIPIDGAPFSLLLTLPPEKTRLARPGEVALLRRLVPRMFPFSFNSARDGRLRRTDCPGAVISVRGEFWSVDEVVETNESSCVDAVSVTNCCIDEIAVFLRILPKFVDLALRRGRGKMCRLTSASGGGTVKPSSSSS